MMAFCVSQMRLLTLCVCHYAGFGHAMAAAGTELGTQLASAVH